MSNESLVGDLQFRFHHTMLPVADLDRAIGFYTRLLGMKPMGRRTDDTRQVEVGHVGYGDRDTHPSLELTQDISAQAPAQVTPTGVHVAIQVDDLQRLCNVLEREQVKFLASIKGTPGRRLVAWIRDPDGHALELVEVHSP